MQKSKFNQNRRQNHLQYLLVICLVTVGILLVNNQYFVSARNDKRFNRRMGYTPKNRSTPAVTIAERVSPWLKLQQGKSAETTFYGTESSISALQNEQVEPVSQTSVDFNADGYNDLIGGFRNAAGGGLIAMHRASKEAFEPQNEQVLADLRRGIFPATFEKDALILDVPTTPDFIFAGRFSNDSALDLVFASRGGNSIYIMSSDGAGGFNAAREIALDGEITALAADTLDASKIYVGLVVATRNEKSSTISVFDGTAELAKTTPRSFSIEGDVNTLILANPDGTSPGKDVFGVADGEIFTMRRVGNQNTSINKIELPMRAVDIAVGEFIRDREAQAEIAVLSEDGNVSYLTRGTLDTRPFTTEEIVSQWKQTGGRGRTAPVSKTVKTNLSERIKNTLSDNWTAAETHQLGVYSPNGNSARALQNSAHKLQKAYITGGETEDLLVTDSTNNRVEVLFKEPNINKNKAAFTGETKLQDVDLAAFPTAVFPMRLNVMGQQGFVVFSAGSLEPTTVIAAPNANFAVTKTADTNDGACNADCSLREAIVAANAAAGADSITFNVNGTFQLTIGGANENAAATGDLDITQALTITGNGSGNTILQAGTTTANGIDKVLSFNPSFTLAFASSISGVTVRFGRNPSTFAGDGFGGGFDWEGSGTGTMTVSGCVVTDNRTTDGDGGGITATNTPVGPGTFTAMNTTIANNVPARSAANSPLGGGIFAGARTPFLLTNVILNNNNVNGSGGQGQGGGIYAFNPIGTTRSFLTGSTVTNNAAPSDGGGIATFQPIDINPTAIISNNLSGRSGGGIFVNHSNATTNISKATMVGNSATTNGGAIYLGTSTTANVLNMSFSRIVGNTAGTFSGLVSTGGTANVENNWWGCNTGPSAAPCDTAGATAPGVVDFNPWLRYTHTASPSSIVVGQSTTLTASFLTNSAGTAIAASNLDVLIGLPIAFNTPVRGTISGAQPTIQASGTATATFTATSAGAGSANAAVDNGTATASITIAQAATTTAVTSNANPSVVGQTVTLTATVSVTAPGSGTPTGTVQFKDGAAVIAGCNAVALSGGTALCMTGALTLGSHTITAVYSGDSNFTGSTSPNFTQTVNKANTTTTITADTPDPSVIGQNYVVTASVSVTSPGTGTPTGTITVSDGTNNCTITLPATSCNLSGTSVGAKTLIATYNGDANFNGSVSAGVAHTVNKAGTTTTINTHTPNPSSQNMAVTVTFSVAVTSPGAGTATSNVTVSDGVNNCTATVAAGSCMITLATSGTRTLTATYAGDANFNGSTSAGVSQTVLAPTAAEVELSGRVLTAAGRGISNAVVSVIDSSGNTRMARTNSFGYFHFAEIQAGETHIISVKAKRYQFAPQVVNIFENIDGLWFIAQ